jgi:maltose/moltooligosaccharide transporter
LGLGIAWASALIMPYVMLSGAIPSQRQGIYQGIFNFFVVLPEVVAALGFGWIMQYLLHENRLLAVVLGGVSLIIASGLTFFLPNTEDLAVEMLLEQEDLISVPETPADEQKVSS